MNIIGLDTLGLILLVLALAIMVTYILWYGWNFEFEKRQFAVLIFTLILFGMFVEAWLRGTGDEILIGFGLFVLALLVIIRGIGRRRRRRKPQ
jgi:hypothetical protein